MLTPERIDRIPDELVELFASLDSKLRGRMAREVMKLDEADRNALTAELRRMSKASERGLQKAVTRALTKAARESLAYDEKLYAAARAAGIVSPYVAMADSLRLKRLLADGIATAGSLVNLTRTAAINAVSAEFTAALDSALIGVLSGTVSRDEAIRSAVKRIAENQTRITYITAGGARVESTLYTAVRRAVVTSANQTTGRMTEARMAEVGADTVLITAHMGARPEHAVWQGEVFKLADLPAETGYGEVDGLMGANCRHSFMPWFPELNTAPDRFDIDSERNQEVYELSQRQRLSESNVRKYQGRANVYREAGFDSEADRNESLAKKWRTEARRTAKAQGGKVRYDRMRADIYPR
jgi:hypothetical protein